MSRASKVFWICGVTNASPPGSKYLRRAEGGRAATADSPSRVVMGTRPCHQALSPTRAVIAAAPCLVLTDWLVPAYHSTDLTRPTNQPRLDPPTPQLTTSTLPPTTPRPTRKTTQRNKMLNKHKTTVDPTSPNKVDEDPARRLVDQKCTRQHVPSVDLWKRRESLRTWSGLSRRSGEGRYREYRLSLSSSTRSTRVSNR